ncbi:MAG TPA: energy transducer TonB [Gammaproteobacteria bacterium]|nr:energy transducer TonB [Gammaproteobacteria bacterium]
MTHEVCKGLFLAAGLSALVAGCATSPSSKPADVSRVSTGARSYTAAVVPPDRRFEYAQIYRVTYAFTVDANGHVHDPSMVSSESPALLVLSSHQALMNASFPPCSDSGDCRRTYTFRYVIPKVIVRNYIP